MTHLYVPIFSRFVLTLPEHYRVRKASSFTDTSNWQYDRFMKRHSKENAGHAPDVKLNIPETWRGIINAERKDWNAAQCPSSNLT